VTSLWPVLARSRPIFACFHLIFFCTLDLDRPGHFHQRLGESCFFTYRPNLGLLMWEPRGGSPRSMRLASLVERSKSISPRTMLGRPLMRSTSSSSLPPPPPALGSGGSGSGSLLWVIGIGFPTSVASVVRGGAHWLLGPWISSSWH